MSKIIHTEADAEANQQNILLQTIYVPKNLMFLTDNLPRPKYESFAASSNYYGSDVENKSLKRKTIERIKYSPKRRIPANNPHSDLVLPDINKKDPKNIMDQIKEKYKKNSSRLNNDKLSDNEILYGISSKMNKKDIMEISPSRVRDLSHHRSESRSHSLDHPSIKSTHNSKEMLKSPSLESLKSRDRSPINKLSSAERIASKLSMHNNKKSLVELESNAYDNNLSMQLNELSILSGKAKPSNIFSPKINSLSSSPRRKSKPVDSYIYNLHQREYDYSIISKNSKRILNNHKRPLKLIHRNELKNNKILDKSHMLPELKYVSNQKNKMPNLEMYIKKPYGRYKSTGKRISELKSKKSLSNSNLKKLQVMSPKYPKVTGKLQRVQEHL